MMLEESHGYFAPMLVRSDLVESARRALLNQLAQDLGPMIPLRILSVSREEWNPIPPIVEAASSFAGAGIIVLLGLEDTPGIIAVPGERPGGRTRARAWLRSRSGLLRTEVDRNSRRVGRTCQRAHRLRDVSLAPSPPQSKGESRKGSHGRGRGDRNPAPRRQSPGTRKSSTRPWYHFERYANRRSRCEPPPRHRLLRVGAAGLYRGGLPLGLGDDAEQPGVGF